MKLVEIVWEDAKCLAEGAWVDRQEWSYTPCICRSVGYVLYEGPEGYIITSSFHEEQTAQVDQIPAKMIVESRVLSHGTI